MLLFALGIISGILIAGFIFCAFSLKQATIERTVNRLHSHFAQKGSIIEPLDPELQAWVDDLKSDE